MQTGKENNESVGRMLSELSDLAIEISMKTDFRASLYIYSKSEIVEIKVYVNPIKTSKIANYRFYEKYENLTDKFEACKEKLQYFLKA